jgi:ribonucleotide reductase alpha subunit
MIAFESKKAQELNIEIFSHIQKEAYAASAKMAGEYGEPSVLE